MTDAAVNAGHGNLTKRRGWFRVFVIVWILWAAIASGLTLEELRRRPFPPSRVESDWAREIERAAQEHISKSVKAGTAPSPMAARAIDDHFQMPDSAYVEHYYSWGNKLFWDFQQQGADSSFALDMFNIGNLYSGYRDRAWREVAFGSGLLAFCLFVVPLVVWFLLRLFVAGTSSVGRWVLDGFKRAPDG